MWLPWLPLSVRSSDNPLYPCDADVKGYCAAVKGFSADVKGYEQRVVKHLIVRTTHPEIRTKHQRYFDAGSASSPGVDCQSANGSLSTGNIRRIFGGNIRNAVR
eukprot:2131657-Pyramimonas_sp.AAC.1